MIKNQTEVVKTSLQYPLMEKFYSIQGEGYFQGSPAYFIRLGGCDVGCHWCDVKESWSPEYPRVKSEDLVNAVKDSHTRIVVVTGGEPLTYNLDELTSSLRREGLRTHIETSGVYELSGDWDWICLSPKKFRKPHSGIWSKADELKIIIHHKSDLDWAITQSLNVKNSCKLYLQPEWSRQNQMLPLIIDFVKDNPKWNISLQIHKFMDIP